MQAAQPACGVWEGDGGEHLLDPAPAASTAGGCSRGAAAAAARSATAPAGISGAQILLLLPRPALTCGPRPACGRYAFSGALEASWPPAPPSSALQRVGGGPRGGQPLGLPFWGCPQRVCGAQPLKRDLWQSMARLMYAAERDSIEVRPAGLWGDRDCQLGSSLLDNCSSDDIHNSCIDQQEPPDTACCGKLTPVRHVEQRERWGHAPGSEGSEGCHEARAAGHCNQSRSTSCCHPARLGQSSSGSSSISSGRSGRLHQ